MSYRLAFHLAEKHEVVYMSYRPFLREKEVYMDGRLTVYSWVTKGRPTGLKDVLHFVRIYARHRPDIVIGHFVGAKISIVTCKILSLFRAKTYEWYHTLSDQIEYDHGRISAFRKFMRAFTFRYFVDTVVPVSHLAERDYRKFYGLDNCRVVINSIRDEYCGVEAEYEDEVLKVGYMGRLLPHKGVDILEKLMADLPSDAFRFRIAGEGQFITEGGVDGRGNVEYLGLIPFSEVRSFIEENHVIIVPSYFDAFNVVAIEALMLKRCLVVSSGAGVSAYLSDGENAIIAEPTFEAFRSALLALHADRGLMRGMAGKGRETFLEKFTLERHIRSVEAMIFG